MKILLLGKDGQVGRELQRTLLPFGEVVACNRQQADLENPSELQRVLQSIKPDLIVNAAAYTAVDKAESDRAAAFLINAETVAALAEYAAQSQALLIHYSTDYVFNGEKSGAYVEDDPTDPLNVYGLSKRAGEEAILHSGCKALVFRTSWVYSAHGNNFVKTILRLAKERNSLNIVADQVGAPTSAELIADVTALAIAAHRFRRLDSGIYHLTANGATNWQRFACHIVERARTNGVSLALDEAQILPIPSSDYPVPAKRPLNSRLDCSRLAASLGLELPDWTLHVDRTIDQLTLSI